MRRAQMEMIGLVFIVIIIVFGILLYVRFSPASAGSGRSARALSSSSFLVALSETTVTDCRAPLRRLAAECVQGGSFCGDPCAQLDMAISAIAAATLEERGVKFNLSLEGTDVGYERGCMSGDPTVDLERVSGVPIVLTGGRGSRMLQLAICP